MAVTVFWDSMVSNPQVLRYGTPLICRNTNECPYLISKVNKHLNHPGEQQLFCQLLGSSLYKTTKMPIHIQGK